MVYAEQKEVATSSKSLPEGTHPLVVLPLRRKLADNRCCSIKLKSDAGRLIINA